MQRMTGIDSLFLALESPTNLFQVGAVTVLDPSTAPPGSPPPHEAMRQVVEGRLDRLGPFHRRPLSAPAGMDHPRWSEVQPDLRHHIRRGALPAPGSDVELAALAADVLSRPLERDRPLWEIHVVEGLEDDLVAGIAKLHHSAVDGVAGVEVTGQLMDLEPTMPPTDAAALDELSDAVPGTLSLLRDAASHAAGRVLPAAGLVGRLATKPFVLRSRNRRLDVQPPPAPCSGPRTRLNAKVGSQRAVGMAHVERSEVEAVRNATGVSVNDIILYLAATALRDHLVEADEQPDGSLVAFVPRAVRGQAAHWEQNVNHLSGMLVSLATEIGAPVVRLMAIAESAASAKEQERVLGESLFSELAELVPPALLAPVGRVVRALGLTTRWPPFSVVVSSFAGPTFPLYCAGAEMVAYHPFGPVIDGAALNITAMSYRDRIGFGLIACRDALPDVALLARRIPEAMTELCKAVPC